MLIRGIGDEASEGYEEAHPIEGEDLVRVLRSIKDPYTVYEGASIMDAAAEFGKKIRSAKTGVFLGVDPGRLSQWIQAAEDEANKYRAKYPWFWQSAVSYSKFSPEYARMNKILTNIYGESAAATTSRGIIKQARTELVDDLKKRATSLPGDLWNRFRPWVVGGGIVIAVVAGLEIRRRYR